MKKNRLLFIIILITLLTLIHPITSFCADNSNIKNFTSENNITITSTATAATTTATTTTATSISTTTNNTASTSKKPSISIGSPSAILIDASTGEILYEKNANEVRYPASTTKIMTAILTLENCKLTDKATVSYSATHSIPADYVHASLVEGEQHTIEDLLNVLLIPSANDAAFVLAEHVGGSVENFSKLMNEKAKEIGCKNTNFVNPNGIHNKKHISTACDLALIARYAMLNPTFRSIVKKTKCTLPATEKYKKEDRIFYTTNKLLVSNERYYYKNAIGIKTGYTSEAGNCLVSGANKNGMEVICVVLGSGFTKQGLSEKFLDSSKLLDYAFNNYSFRTLNARNSVFQEVEVKGATDETKNLKLLVKDDINVLLEKSVDTKDFKPEVTIEKLRAPISAGSAVGKISYVINNKEYTSDLIAESDVLPSRFLPMLFHILLIIVTLYLIYILLKSKKNSNNINEKKDRNSRYSKYNDSTSKSRNKDKSKSKDNRKSKSKNFKPKKGTTRGNLRNVTLNNF